MFIDLSLPVISADTGNPEKSSRDEALVRLGHSGTHLDTILRSGVPLDYLRSRGVVLDFSAFSREREALVSDLPANPLASGDFVLIRTGGMPFTVFTMCFDLGGSGIPCRVIAEVKRGAGKGKRATKEKE